MPTSPALFALFLATLPLPGALLVLGAGLHRPRTGAALAGALALLLSCAFTSLVALAAALAGVFDLGLVVAAQAAAAALGALAWRPRLRAALAELAA
ncbi:MAG: hypothetical protein HY825_20015, partial [Acidobacteria bacterium]|nr:hypothetical protein [Acidobacteriota bacterium]